MVNRLFGMRTILRPAAGSALRRRLAAAPGAAVIGFFKGIASDDDFAVFLDAAERLAADPPAPFHFAVCGRGGASEVMARGLAGQATLLERPSDRVSLLRQMDLVVLPSRQATVEALTAGIPVLAADCSGLRDLLCGTPARTFAAGDAAALSHGLHLALTRPWTAAAQAYAPAAQARFGRMRSVRAAA